MAKTDPARELAQTLEKILGDGSLNNNNDDVIARLARVAPWSADFFKVIFEIVQRCELVEREIQKLEIDDDIKQDALTSVKSVKRQFSQKSLVTTNLSSLKQSLSGNQVTILKMLSSQIRANISYEALTEEERVSLLSDVNELLEWLQELQDDETDFIRQALIEGLQAFSFRLDRLDWFGSGYALDSLKRVFEAYMALEGVKPQVSNGDELITAILLKTKGLLSRTASAFGMARSSTENVGWALQTYGAVSAVTDGSTTITGLIGG